MKNTPSALDILLRTSQSGSNVPYTAKGAPPHTQRPGTPSDVAGR